MTLWAQPPIHLGVHCTLNFTWGKLLVASLLDKKETNKRQKSKLAKPLELSLASLRSARRGPLGLTSCLIASQLAELCTSPRHERRGRAGLPILSSPILFQPTSDGLQPGEGHTLSSAVAYTAATLHVLSSRYYKNAS